MLEYQPMRLSPEAALQEVHDWVTAQRRIMRAGLENHEEEAVATAYFNVKDRLGEQFAEALFVRTVFWMIELENFSFVEEPSARSDLV